MRKLKEVLRLHSLGLSQHQIARSCCISQSTVHEYVSAAQAAGVTWPLAETYGAGLGEGPPGPADAQGSDAATGLAGGSREPPGRLRLQPILRFVPAVAEEARPGAAARAPRRREDVRGLRRSHDSDSRSEDR